MAEKLVPSKATKMIIDKYKPLTKEEEYKYVEEYRKNRSEKAAAALLFGVVRVFASAIYNNESKFLAQIPDVTFDDLFNEMVLRFYTKLPEFDPSQAKLNTWITWNIKPLVLNTVKTMRRKFDTKHRPKSLDEPVTKDGDSLGKFLPDGSIDVEDNYEKGSQKNKLERAIKKLKKEDQEIIMNLFGYVEPKKEWQSKTGKINAASIARGMGISADRVRARVERILTQLKSDLSQGNFDRYFSVDKLIRQYTQNRGKVRMIESNDISTIFIDNDKWHLRKIDSTHFVGNFRDSNVPMGSPAYHVAEFRGEKYYQDLVDWLHGKKKINGNKY